MELSVRERKLLADLARDLRRDFGATEIRLYGSATRGALTADSDIDLYIVVPDLTWPLERAICDRCYDVTLQCGRMVSPCVVSQRELAETALRVSPLIRTVEQQGVNL